MKKITKKEIIKILKTSVVDFYYSGDIEYEAKLLYNKARYMPYDEAKRQIEYLASSEEIYIDLVLKEGDCEDYNEDDIVAELDKINEELGELGYEFTNDTNYFCEFGGEIFLSFFNPCLKDKDREKYEDDRISEIKNAINKHNTMFKILVS